QVIINTEPNKLVDGESDSVTCYYNNVIYSQVIINTEPNKLVDGESGQVIINTEPNELVDGESGQVIINTEPNELVDGESGQVIINTEPNELVDGESGSVTCYYNNAYTITLSRSGDDSNIANCFVTIQEQDCNILNPGCENNYTDYREFYTASKTTTSVTIHIDTVSKQRDDGIWRCRVDELPSESFQINKTINVKVPVKGVEIENKNSLNLVNGVSTTMNCKVTNNPDPVINYRWFIVETDQILSTSSSFRLTPNKNQNGQTLSCSADNGYGSSKSDTVILDVKYELERMQGHPRPSSCRPVTLHPPLATKRYTTVQLQMS
ncbi:hypothetical protein LOTGIDRAFT_176223, partial [Lottia gigantea]